jgi:hypothetical protein
MISQVNESVSWTLPLQQPYYCNYTTDYLFQDVQGGRHSLGMSIVSNPSSPACIQYDITTTFNSGGDPLVSAYVSNNEEPVLVADADCTVFHFANPFAHSTSQSPVLAGLPDYIEDRTATRLQ